MSPDLSTVLRESPERLFEALKSEMPRALAWEEERRVRTPGRCSLHPLAAAPPPPPPGPGVPAPLSAASQPAESPSPQVQAAATGAQSLGARPALSSSSEQLHNGASGARCVAAARPPLLLRSALAALR
ncbi:unnamed protein product [Rangifer tarandus platyrhynchus]|uniref:Uncharacterized protein n=2 Tax=Rangifer tarandus platyrhynchus TaxID=3082113 RepID=A0ABN8XVW4_RANTA|nr:unnamed protein product [Rangifer tarandus platyrhynchus]CAI9692293.1 unnamed protein product [Rangifer tarandus platyrhynchus]